MSCIRLRYTESQHAGSDVKDGSQAHPAYQTRVNQSRTAAYICSADDVTLGDFANLVTRFTGIRLMAMKQIIGEPEAGADRDSLRSMLNKVSGDSPAIVWGKGLREAPRGAAIDILSTRPVDDRHSWLEPATEGKLGYKTSGPMDRLCEAGVQFRVLLPARYKEEIAKLEEAEKKSKEEDRLEVIIDSTKITRC